MQCPEFEDRLNAVLDERGDPAADPRLAAHAQECDPCQARLAGSRLLLRGIRQRSVPPLDAEFSRRVVAHVAPPPVLRPVSRRWLAAGVLLASAASALLAISLVWYARRGGESLVGGTNVPAAPAHENAGHHSPRPSLAYAFRGGDLLLDAPRMPSLRNYRGAIGNLAVALPQTVEQLDQMERIAPGLRPLRLSLAMLWGTLRHSIPGARSEEPAHPTQPRSRASLWPFPATLVA